MENTRLISAAAIEYAKSRRIGRGTLERLGVASGTVFFPDPQERQPALLFWYGADGDYKARSFPGKSFATNKGFRLAFWNIERVLNDIPDEVYITEGELDACALVESGIDVNKVLSVPNGARERKSDNVSTESFAYVDDALKAGLNRVKRIIWCGDEDKAGLSLRLDMVRIFGQARFWTVRWPDGCKDANDLLRTDGPQDLYDLVTDGRTAWPVSGLYRLSEVPDPPPLTTWNTGFLEWNKKVHLAPRTLSVVTGQPGHGKTLCFAQIWFQIARAYGVPICVASFETRAKPHMRRILRTLYIGTREWNQTEAEQREADDWINGAYVFLMHAEQRPTLEWFLEMAEVAVVRHGCRVIQLDPWNRLEGSRTKGENENDYIARCLRTVYGFANDMNCHVQIIAHPAKMDGGRRNAVPELEDVSGSKSWDSMADQGFVIHRPKLFEANKRVTEANFYCRKARFDELGYPCRLPVNFDLALGKYVPVLGKTEPQAEPPQD